MRSTMLRIALTLAALTWALPAHSAPADDAMTRGQEARRAADFPTAERAFQAAADLAPLNPETWHMLGLVQAFQAKYETALQSLARAQSLAPGDQDISLSIARVNGFAGNYDAADSRVEKILAATPNNIAAWTLKGRIASYRKDYRAARAAYERAAQIAKPDVDLLVAFGDLERLEGREAAALEYYRQAEALDPASVDVAERLKPKSAEPPSGQWRLALAGGKSWLSRTPAPDWTALEATLSREVTSSTTVFGGLSYAKRFSQDDVMVRAGAASRFGPLFSASLEAGFTPDDDVLPEFQAFGTLSARLAPGGSGVLGATVAALDGQIRHYNSGTVKTLSPGFDQYFGGDALVVSLRVANTWDTNDKHLLGWSVAALWNATDRLNLRIGYGNAPEAERGVVADTKSLTGGLGIEISDRFRWRVDITREKRQGSYRRVELTTGPTLLF